jgi:FkbM family methyltransferase
MFNQPFGRMAARNRYVDIKAKLNSEKPFIVDGGAHVGNVIDFFLKQYAAPTIHAFEPNPDLIKVLESRYLHQTNINIYPYALGVKSDNVQFNIVNAGSKGGASSVLSPSEILKFYHGDNAIIEKSIEVSMVRLDKTLCDVEAIDICKLDLQGYELEALQGSEQLLDRIKIITTEIEFVPLYDQQPLFADIDKYLRNHNFRLLNLYELWTHPDGQLTSGDAVYLNNNYFPFKK